MMAACLTPSAITYLPQTQCLPSSNSRWPACAARTGIYRDYLCNRLETRSIANFVPGNALLFKSKNKPVPRRQSHIKCASDQTTNSQLREAARHTVDLFIRSGMVIGLGSGPASCMAIEYIGQKLKEGSLQNVIGVPTSALCAAEASKCGVPLTTLEEYPKLSFGFTDADFVQEGTLYSIICRKGVNGRDSIYREKKMVVAVDQFVVLVSEQAFVEELGGEVPVIIQNDEWEDIAEEIDEAFIGDAEIWRRPSSGTAGPLGGDYPLVTEQGHFVLDVIFTTVIEDPKMVGSALENIPGVVGHGLLLDHIYGAAVGTSNGVKIRTSLFKEAFTTKE